MLDQRLLQRHAVGAVVEEALFCHPGGLCDLL